MSTILVTISIALVVALAVIAVAVAGAKDGTAMLADLRAARATRRAARRRVENGEAVPTQAARRHVFAAAHRDLVEAADAEDGLDELMSWSKPAEGYLTAAELAGRLRTVVRR